MRSSLRPGQPGWLPNCRTAIHRTAVHRTGIHRTGMQVLALVLVLGAPAGGLMDRGVQAAPATASSGSTDTTELKPAAAAPAPLSVEEARAAAERILKAVQSKDPNRRFAQFSPELQAISSPAMVAETMRTQPDLLGWTLLSVRGGLASTTVEASLRTSDGVRDLFMVLDPQGRLTGYHFDLTDAESSRVAADFVRELSRGHFISARSYLALPLQDELTPATLQAKWQELQRSTGTFVKVVRVIEASRSEDSQLVLVNTEFNRVTDNLFVILNTNNEITGVDFPKDPNPPQPAPAPAR
jgi:hypothetical protein